MTSPEKFIQKIFSDEFNFEETALELFHFQVEYVAIYRRYIELLKIDSTKINSIRQIPFLPIEFFKTHKVVNSWQLAVGSWQAPILFTSSGTTGNQISMHHVQDVSLYEKSFTKCFENFYGNIEDYCFLALLPSYLERSGSSLVYMTNDLINKSKHPLSGFYLNEYDTLIETLIQLKKQNQKTILIGVTYALLDLAEILKSSNVLLPILEQERWTSLFILETGGMKGQRKEMVREEVHSILCESFGVEKIHSEYGMTELLSQAYSNGNGFFKTPPWMKILIREMNDVTNFIGNERTGGINVIDLANVYSCAFIASQDLGRTHADNTFEVLGRFDDSDLRGCNLLVD